MEKIKEGFINFLAKLFYRVALQEELAYQFFKNYFFNIVKALLFVIYLISIVKVIQKFHVFQAISERLK